MVADASHPASGGPIPPRSPRLLLVSYDELGILYDALFRYLAGADVGDPEFDDIKGLLERVGDLMSMMIVRE